MFKKLFQLSLVLIAALCLEGTVKSAEPGQCLDIVARCGNKDCDVFTDTTIKEKCQRLKPLVPSQREYGCRGLAKDQLRLGKRDTCS
jgi:hypothetical protein